MRLCGTLIADIVFALVWRIDAFFELDENYRASIVPAACEANELGMGRG